MRNPKTNDVLDAHLRCEISEGFAASQLSERSPLAPDTYWLPVKDGDRRALALYLRHYSARHYKDGRARNLFVGPGEKLVLMTFQCHALFVWRKFISMDHQEGVSCSVFRNESTILSSTLVLEAMRHAWRKWPGERLYTYVDARKIKSTNPGYCFKRAGWSVCGTSRGGLVILEVRPLVPDQCGGSCV